MKKLEIGGSRVTLGHPLRLVNYPNQNGYTDAQIDDGVESRKRLPWEQGTRMEIRARFSEGVVGTAGFGFWNRPFADPTIKYPALPRAAWFFFGSPPDNNLPLNVNGAGNGWHAATVDGTSWRAKSMIPFAPLVLLLNQFPKLRQLVWPRVLARAGVSYRQIEIPMTEWHDYQIDWLATGCEFRVDNIAVLKTNHSPEGRMTFVCWIDNQFMRLENTGKAGFGFLPIIEKQDLEIQHLHISKLDSGKY